MQRNPHALEEALARLEQAHLRRRRRTVEAYPDPEDPAAVLVKGRRLLNFCGNDYLGLAQHPTVAQAMSEAALRYGAGSGASHLVTGHGIEHERLEEELAAFTGRERALLFSTGYMANLAVIGALAERGDIVLLDRLNHASLIDAGLLAGARFKRYKHADTGAAEQAIEAITASSADRSIVIATDGVFSMDGDLAPLPELASLTSRHGAWLVVDDAHGLGVLGATGRGTLEHFKLDVSAVPVLVGTLGKAFGSFGAFVAGSADLIDYMMQRARSYIYTTALPQPIAAATRKALEISEQESWRRERVLALTARFRAAARQLGIPLTSSTTPIQPVIVGSAQHALRVSEKLDALGFWVAAIRPPTVPANTARLRITLSAAHTEAQVDALVEALGKAIKT